MNSIPLNPSNHDWQSPSWIICVPSPTILSSHHDLLKFLTMQLGLSQPLAQNISNHIYCLIRLHLLRTSHSTATVPILNKWKSDICIIQTSFCRTFMLNFIVKTCTGLVTNALHVIVHRVLSEYICTRLQALLPLWLSFNSSTILSSQVTSDR